MNQSNELSRIEQLFEVLLPLSKTEREEYLILHSEVPVSVMEQTLLLLEADHGDSGLPSLENLLVCTSAVAGDQRRG